MVVERAFELADLREDLRRDRHGVVGPHRPQHACGGLLVRRVRVAVQERDRDRDGAAVQQALRCGSDLAGIDLCEHRPVGQRALGDADPQVARRHRHEVAPQTPRRGPVATAHLEHVGEAVGGDDAGARTAAFEQRVGADGRAVHDRADLCELVDRVGRDRP